MANTRSALAACLVALFASVTIAADGPRLVEAAKHQRWQEVRALVGTGSDVNARQDDGATALHWAAHWADAEVTDLLLRAGANASAETDLGVTPLALACESGTAAIVQRLLTAGAHADARSARRPAALLVCARSGTVEGVRALLARGADLNAAEPLRGQTALMWAAAQGHADVVKLLLEHKADLRLRSQLERVVVNRADPNDANTAVVGEVSRGHATALLFAASSGQVECARLLLDAGADVNDTAPDGSSALVIAVHGGHRALAQLLLDRGANPNVVGAGYSALHAAVLRGDPEIVRRLLARGARVDALLQHGTPTIRAGAGYVLPENLAGATPLLLAAKFLEIEAWTQLVARGANARLTLHDGTTALMLAAGLLSQGALFDRRGRITVLRMADEDAALETVKLVVSQGVNVNAANARGETALHGAAARGYPKVVRFLLEQGARRTARSAAGQTPFDVADASVKDLLGDTAR